MKRETALRERWKKGKKERDREMKERRKIQHDIQTGMQ